MSQAEQHHITSFPAGGSARQIGPVTAAIRAMHSKASDDDLPREVRAAVRAGLDQLFAALGMAVTLDGNA